MFNTKKHVKYSTVIKTIVKDLDMKYVKPQRAGVIIYTVYEGTTYFCLGLDSNTHELTDFGGSVKYKIDGTPVVGALREFEEETLSIFDTISPEDIKHYPVLYDDHNMIIFINMHVDPESACEAFNTKYKIAVENNENPEVCGMTWLTWSDFQSTIRNQSPLYSRVKSFLNRAGNFWNLL